MARHSKQSGFLQDKLSAGRLDVVQERLAVIRQTGAWVGLGTHTPEVIEHAEASGWDVDFYMASAYNLYGGPRESLIVTGRRGPESASVPRDEGVVMQSVFETIAGRALLHNVQ